MHTDELFEEIDALATTLDCTTQDTQTTRSETSRTLYKTPTVTLLTYMLHAKRLRSIRIDPLGQATTCAWTHSKVPLARTHAATHAVTLVLSG